MFERTQSRLVDYNPLTTSWDYSPHTSDVETISVNTGHLTITDISIYWQTHWCHIMLFSNQDELNRSSHYNIGGINVVL